MQYESNGHCFYILTSQPLKILKHESENNIIIICYCNSESSDMTGDSGVLRYDLEYGLSEEITIDVSDHYPVFATFSINEIEK